ncbi:MAG: ABC transporter ATP-binding protein [Armatimonadota bacterium]
MASAITIKNLKKVYKGKLSDTVTAVNDISFEVQEGEIFGFIGPNGAGKTTTIKMLLGLIFPSAGEATVLGKPAGDIETKNSISYLPETPYFYEHMTGKEILDFYCSLFKLKKNEKKEKIEFLLNQVGLEKDGDRSLRQYSKGMLQRIGIAQSLINDPDLLFYDEPTSGLDPIAHKDILDLIFSLKKQGKTVFLSSHQLSDVESVCDRVAIINRGELVKIGTMDDLLRSGRIVITLLHADESIIDGVKNYSERVSQDNEQMKIYTDSEENLRTILDIARNKSTLVSVLPQRQTLEDLFVETVREVKK